MSHLSVLLLLTATASGADITSARSVDRQALRLSDSVHVTLTITGDAPLRVELPAEILDEPSAAIWRARPSGPAHIVDLPDHRQRWTRIYRIDPYVPGDAVKLGFAPAQVFAGNNPQPKTATWPPLTIRVTTSVQGDATEARPPTGIEELPPVGSTPRPLKTWVLGPVALITLLIGGAILLLRLIRRSSPPLTAEQLAIAQLDELTHTDAARLSDILRQFVEATTPIPATTLTTTELLRELEQVETWPAERVAELATVLHWCDAIKFAGRQPSEADAAGAIAAARQIISLKTGPARSRRTG